jgi:hypothetical protein
LNVLAGLPDKGKGLAWSDIVAHLTTGSDWPANEGKAPQGKLIIFTAEDAISNTVVPRLAAAGADLTRGHHPPLELGKKNEQVLSAMTYPRNPTGKGGWKSGQSGNPSGRPKVVGEIRALAREHTAAALEALVEIVGSKKAPPAARVAAANAILDRGYGRPETKIDATIEQNSAADSVFAGMSISKLQNYIDLFNKAGILRSEQPAPSLRRLPIAEPSAPGDSSV